ncbi:MAG: ferritin-like domain-containing protein [Actinomycetota bacterium]|nr:ferritin-like domain-containing protein [Actinomycetota bacterium]
MTGTHSAAPGPELVTDPDTAAAVQTALGTEHAAVWCYGLVAAFLPTVLDQRASTDAAAHRARRDATAALLTDAGLRPVTAEPAYRSPAPVTDQTSAVALALVAESDAAAAWRSVLERCDDPGLRRAALDGLSDAAIRAAYWSDRAGTRPVVSPFPGWP